MNNTTFDVILVTNTPVYPKWHRGHGAHRLASHLRENGFSTLVIDFCDALTFDIWKDICENAIGDNTRMVGFSSTWWPYRVPFQQNKLVNKEVNWADLDNFFDFIKNEVESNGTLLNDIMLNNSQRWVDVVKNKNPKTKITLGGPKIDFYLDFPADNFIDGYAETEIIDYLTDTRRIWPKVIQHDTTAMSRDWGWTTSSTKYTDFDLLRPNELLTIEISRGCRFKCAFCTFPMIGRKDYAAYTKTEETIYNELMENYEKWGSTDYWIADDTFNDSIEKLEMILRITKRLPFKIKFRSYIRLDIIAKQPEQIQMLYDLGLKECWIGIETFHPMAAKVVGKGMSEEKRKETLYNIQKIWKNDVAVTAGYIIGLPGEDEEFLYKQLEWASQKDCPINMGVNFIPLVLRKTGAYKYVPTSEMERNPEKYGYSFLNDDIHEWKNNLGGIKDFREATTLAAFFNQTVQSRITKAESAVSNGIYTAITDPVKEYFLPLIQMLKEKIDIAK